MIEEVILKQQENRSDCEKDRANEIFVLGPAIKDKKIYFATRMLDLS